MNVYYISKNCIDISAFCNDKVIAENMKKSAIIRNETLNRVYAIKNYLLFTPKIRLYYYDKIKKQVEKEMKSGGMKK